MATTTIVFDLDGTLIHSAPDVCRALNATLTKLGRREHSVTEVQGYLGWGAPILISKALAATGGALPEDQVSQITKDFLDFYAEHPIVDTVIFPGALEALRALKGGGFRLGICTNKPSVTAAPVLDQLGLNGYFEAVICGDQVAKKKPDGGHVLDTIQALGGNRESSVMIGDSENDIDAANHAGVSSIAVTFGYAHARPEDLGANALIDHFDELGPLIHKLTR